MFLKLKKPHFIIPIAVTIVIAGAGVPIYNTVIESRCYLTHEKIIESTDTGFMITIDDGQSADLAKDQPVELEPSNDLTWLLKHPELTLKMCLEYEKNNPGNPRNTSLGEMAYEKVTGETLECGETNLSTTIKATNYSLWEMLNTSETS